MPARGWLPRPPPPGSGDPVQRRRAAGLFQRPANDNVGDLTAVLRRHGIRVAALMAVATVLLALWLR